MPVVLAYVSCVVLAVLVVLQTALVGGAPLGRFAWGGAHDVLPARDRGYSALLILGYAVAAVVVLQGADLLALVPVVAAVLLTYVFTVVFFAAFVLTATSRSEYERRLMLPANLALSALFLIVAVTGHVKF
jgi:NADH:ubiquinone oxidoreductase subunit 6 (subunit J)